MTKTLRDRPADLFETTGGGNLGSAPEISYVAIGGDRDNMKAIAKMTICVNSAVREGKEVADTTFLNAEIWGQAAERLAELSSVFTTGAQVNFTGRFQQNNWTDKEGNNHSRMAFRVIRLGLNLFDRGFDQLVEEVQSSEDEPF